MDDDELLLSDTEPGNLNQPTPSAAESIAIAQSGDRETSLIDLPVEPESFDVETLQNELTELAETLIGRFPTDAGSWHFAGQIFSELKQSERAEECWQKSIGLSPQYLGPYLGFASMLAKKGQDAEALEVLQKASELGGKSPELSLQMAECHENLGQLEQALEAVESGMNEFPDDDQLLMIHGRIKTQTGDYDAAQVSIERTIKLRGKSEAALVALTNVLVRKGERESARQLREEIQALKKSVATNEDRFQEDYDAALRRIASGIFISAGSLWEKNAELAQAEKLYLRGLSLNPSNLLGYKGLQMILTRQMRYRSLKSVIERQIEFEPDSLVHAVNLASTCMQLKDGEGAERILKQAEAEDPDGILIQTSLAKIYLVLNRPQEARKYAALVVERNPNRETYHLLATTHEACGDVTAAQASLARGQESSALPK